MLTSHNPGNLGASKLSSPLERPAWTMERRLAWELDQSPALSSSENLGKTYNLLGLIFSHL